MLTLIAVAVIVVAVVYGAQVANTRRDTKVCVAVTCHIDSPGAEGTEAIRLRYPSKDRPEEY